ncbi:MAG: hypothetical protein R6U61_02355 [Thermoplasmata archaeon]
MNSSNIGISNSNTFPNEFGINGTNVAYENWSDGRMVRYTHPLAGYGMEGCGSCGKVCGHAPLF